jgi:hypothetical protein
MDPLISWLIFAALTGGAVYVGVKIAQLTWNYLVQWFQKYRNSIVNKEQVAFTLQEKLASGKYKTVQGIFNPASQQVTDARNIESDQIDAKVRDAHLNEPLVIWQQ